MTDTPSSLVIDNGSGSIKCGFSGEEAPKSIFPTCISQETQLVGDESIKDIIYPIRHGIIKDFDSMEKIWEHTFKNELRVPSDDKNILLSDTPIAPKINREKITQLMFEKFNVNGLFMSIQALLSMYSAGKTTGLILDSGYDVTCSVPIIEGYNFPYTITNVNCGGKIITDGIINSINNLYPGKINFNYETRKNINFIKESFTYYSSQGNSQPNNEENNNNNNNNKLNKFMLPDGEEIDIKDILYNCIESVFKPELLGNDIPGIHYQVYNSIMKSESEIRKELYGNIILAGGNTMFIGFPEKLGLEIQKIAPTSLVNKVKIISQNERKYSAWIGGAILAGLTSFQFMWISHNEYQDSGPQVIHRKCL